MNKKANTDSIPIDLITEILSRLPAKSIGRFHCVSKQWDSILRRPYFTELFRTRSSSNPRLLIGVVQHGECCFFSTPQPKNPYEKSSLVVAADLHMKFSVTRSIYLCRYASRFIYFPNIGITTEGNDEVHVICNPSTGQYAFLPPSPYENCYGFLGFDPIGKQFKVLGINNTNHDEPVLDILTLGTEKARWRKIQCSLSHFHLGREICINGVLYYLALPVNERYAVIVCFDVRSEKVRILNVKLDILRNYWSSKLINYKGKLGVVYLENNYDSGVPYNKLFMWVLEDVKKQTWSSYVYTLKAENNIFKVNNNLSVVGATARGEIVLAKTKAWKPFYVFYFNPERNTLRSVEIQGVSKEEEWINNHEVYLFVDHVEDLQFNI